MISARVKIRDLDVDFSTRIKFNTALAVMEVDLSNVTFANPGIVRQFYDEVDQQMEKAGGQGNRVKDLCGEEAGEEVVVPGGHFAFEAQ